MEGKKFDPLRCKKIKYGSYGFGTHQCYNKPSTAAGYCKLHDPDILNAKREARSKIWDEQAKKRRAEWDRQERINLSYAPMLAALKNLVVYCAGMNYDLGPAHEAIRIAEGNDGKH